MSIIQLSINFTSYSNEFNVCRLNLLIQMLYWSEKKPVANQPKLVKSDIPQGADKAHSPMTIVHQTEFVTQC